jgi:methylated-DNA-[protein]-cysteine S-methyltransferase
MSEPETFFIDKMKSPIGTAILIADEEGRLRFHSWDDAKQSWRKAFQRRYGDAKLVAHRDRFGHAAVLERYFEGEITALDGMRVAFTGTPFQNKVWKALRKIPGGTTLSYGALARRIGEPKAVRAVGLANGSNPIGLIVPCHRVVGHDGSLTGYGGGLPRKRWLLDHEAKHSTFRLEMTA